ncbi:hypothetical protein ACFL35_17860 [Candidatus Riflebacteria bacterium]
MLGMVLDIYLLARKAPLGSLLAEYPIFSRIQRFVEKLWWRY